MTRMSRRVFLRSTVALGAGAVLTRFSDGRYRIALAAAGPEVYQLRIIHTNDHHSRIEPAPEVRLSSTALRNLGGVARRKTLFDQIRADPSVQDKIFLDAGDVFQGTLYFNQYQGAADLFFYNQLGYAAVGIGNHEFDKGDQVLADFIGAANFPLVSANITASAPSPLTSLQVSTDITPNGKLGQRTIVTTDSGQTIGIFGLTTADTPNISSPSANVQFNADLAAVAQAQVAALTAAGCNKIIALTHIGFQLDRELAAQTRGIDVIVGGHSHTPLLPNSSGPQPFGVSRLDVYPVIVPDLDGNNVVVVQDWEWAKWVGDLIVGFDAEGRVSSVSSGSAIRPVWADGIVNNDTNRTPRQLIAGEGAEIVPDSAFQSKIDTDYKPTIVALGSRVVGSTPVELPSTNVRAAETLIGNLIADAFRDRLLKATNDNPNNLPIVAIVNGGGIRTSIPAGAITVGKVLEVMPFTNTMSRVDLTGAQLKAALENGVSALGGTAGTGRFAQVAGLRFVFNRRRTAASPPIDATSTTPAQPARRGDRVLSIEVLEGDSYKPLDLQKSYRVVTNNFMLAGGDGYFVFTTGGDRADPSVGGGKNQLDTGLVDADVVQEYIAAKSPLNLQLEGRIQEVVQIYLPLIGKVSVTR